MIVSRVLSATEMAGDHLSGMTIARHLDAAYPKVITRRTATAFCLALLRMGFTKAAEVTHSAGGLLPHLFTLTTHYLRSRSAV